MNDGDIFEVPAHPGLHFRVHIEHDDTNEAPWEREDGHGPVRCISEYHRCDTTQKKPGERVLHTHREQKWLYDWQEACRLARKDWAVPGTPGEKIVESVQADFDRLRRWLSDDWRYVGVCVEVVGKDGMPPLTSRHSLWGIESDCEDYIKEVAHELADDAADEYAKAMEGARNIVSRAMDAERWNKFRNIVKTKDLGTEFDEQGKPHSPQFRRWYIDTAVNLLTLDAAIDSLKDGS